jgi:hypothetical protein
MIAHKEIHDKLKLLAAAGMNTDGVDYAIPQFYFDKLQEMGIENPGRSFATDCSGPGALPRLVSLADAFYMILHHRSKANTELIPQLFAAAHSEGASTGDVAMFDIIRNNEEVMAECDAGLVNLQMVVDLICEAYARGGKDMKKAIDATDLCQPDKLT